MSRSLAPILLPCLWCFSIAPAAAQRGQGAKPDTTSEEVWRNYDFVPGRRVLKVVDFEGQPVGRFPANKLTFVRGNAQVVKRDDKLWLEASSNAVVRLELAEEFGDAFSIEFTARVPTANIGISVYPTPVAGAASRYPHDFLQLSARPGIYRAREEVSAIRLTDVVGRDVAVKLQVVRGVAIAYVDAIRVAQVPTAQFPSSRVIEFHLDGNARFPTYLTDIVVAAGAGRCGLTEEGRRAALRALERRLDGRSIGGSSETTITWRSALELEARRLRSALISGGDYAPTVRP